MRSEHSGAFHPSSPAQYEKEATLHDINILYSDVIRASAATHSIRQRVLIRVLRRGALLYLLQQQWVFDQTASRQIQEVPQVQFPAERRLLTQAQEVLHSLLVLFLVQQGFGPNLITAVCDVGLQTRELQSGEREWGKER